MGWNTDKPNIPSFLYSIIPVLVDTMKIVRHRKRFNFGVRFNGKLVLFLLAAVFFFLFHFSATASAPKDVKRVLVLFPGQSDLAAYPLTERGIKSALAAGTEFRIEYFIEYMDRYRNADQIHYQQLLDLYRHKYSGTKMDLIIAFSAPALIWVIAHGDEIFPQTPVVFTAILEEHLKSLNLKANITGALANIDFVGLLETALKIHPQTRHIAIVNGASKTDLYFEKKIRKALEPYTNQFDLIYLTRLPLDRIAEKVQNLPEHTVVLFYLLTRDGAGKGFPPWEAASIVADAANAPVYGCLETYLGHGIVGGRLSSIEMSGVKAGEIGLRILRGAKPSDITPSGQGTILNLFDGRALKRWGISEDQLPPDSIVRFRTPSFWDLYRWYIMAAILLILFGCSIISLLLVQRKRLQRSEFVLTERLRFEQMLSELSARLVNASPAQMGEEIKRALKFIVQVLHIDRTTVYEASEKDQKLLLVHSYRNIGVAEAPSEIKFDHLPWLKKKIFNGEMINVSHPDDLPEEAGAEKDFFHALGIISSLVIPLSTGQETLGFMGIGMMRKRSEWQNDLIRQCVLVAEIFATAMARKRSEEALVQSKNFNRSTLDSLKYEIAVLDREGNILDVNQSWRQFARENDAGSLDRLGTGINYLEVCRRSSDSGDKNAQAALEGIQSVLEGSREQFMLEYPCDSPAEKRWFLMGVTRFSGRKGGIIISHSDISERKLADMEVRDAYMEIEQLKNQLEAETAYLQEEIKLEHNLESIIGNSAVIQHVLFKVEQVADTDTSVLVLGETGTGKELVARAIHSSSSRKQHPLVKVNCAALPSNLIESELFGHEAGAFTDAQTHQKGRFEVANGTSIFLDEIGELPIELQTKLLGVLQDGEFQRLGNSRTIQVNVRVIAATNRDLEEQVRQGRFREDLFYRLNVFPITVPPLRDRMDDLPSLVEFFVEKASRRLGKSIKLIPTSVMNTLRDHPWPGNVRELENVIERAVINSSGPKLRLVDELKPLPQDLPTPLKTMEAVEFDHIVRVLEHTDWKVSGKNGAAEILGLKRGTLRARMQKLGIRKP
jgi:transcriptional regulator with GAF, ATPase, and Fis domain/ABC-type uncharacterized transport system substrate-binding protein